MSLRYLWWSLWENFCHFQANNKTVHCTAETISTLVCISGTFRCDEKKDKILLIEVWQKQPHLERTGSKEAGHKWSAIEDAVNTHANFAVIPRDRGSVRERFNKLISDFNTIMRKEKKAFGISPDDLSELDQILQEIQ